MKSGHMLSTDMARILKVQTSAIHALTDFLYKEGVTQLMPVMLSPETDPLCHSTYGAEIGYLGQQLHLTKSMILHKQIALMLEPVSKIFIMSPNIRLEKTECMETGRHLIEFTQLDIEFRDCTKQDFMLFTEKMVSYAIGRVKQECGKELEALGREIEVPSIPFKVYDSADFQGSDRETEAKLSADAKEPFWILNHKREFYDREDKARKGYYHNYDLVWPEAYGEALSGGEREYEYSEIERKMKERGMEPETFAAYLDFARKRMLRPSAGGGIGIERFVRYLCGKKDIAEISPFPRKAGARVIF
ncbi:MAG: asparagine synthetase A [Nanoarchaeota archaeon]